MSTHSEDSRPVVIVGGTVITPSGALVGDVICEQGRITTVGPCIGGDRGRGLDARGCYVIPGGVDPHTHFQYSVGPEASTADDFASGTAAAACGGTTTVFDFAKRLSGKSLTESCARREQEVAAAAIVDFAFHATVTAEGLRDDLDDDCSALREAGVASIKIFLAYPGRMMIDDFAALRVMAAAAQRGMIVAVHAENGHLVEAATRRLVTAGTLGARHHPAAHPDSAEEEAIGRAIALAQTTGCRLYIVHVSTARGAASIAEARRGGTDVIGETCPQYLVCALEDYCESDAHAARYICSPPIRARANQTALWDALAEGDLSAVGTDHAPFHIGGGAPAQSSRGPIGDLRRLRSGVPGVEERLALLYTFGVQTGRMTVERFVDCVSTAPARAFGLYPRKGAIVAGADADIVVWDPQARRRLSVDSQRSKVDYNLYEGVEVGAWPRYVLSRGQLIVADGNLLGAPGRGRRLGADCAA